MTDCLVAFARTGDPSTAATAWPQWMPKAESYFEFGDTSGVREEDAGRMDFYTPANVTPWTPPAARD
jgi:para-nitrobenzyl esterase